MYCSFYLQHPWYDLVVVFFFVVSRQDTQDKGDPGSAIGILTRSNPCRGNEKAVAEMRDMSTAKGHSVRLLEAQRVGREQISVPFRCHLPIRSFFFFWLHGFYNSEGLQFCYISFTLYDCFLWQTWKIQQGKPWHRTQVWGSIKMTGYDGKPRVQSQMHGCEVSCLCQVGPSHDPGALLSAFDCHTQN